MGFLIPVIIFHQFNYQRNMIFILKLFFQMMLESKFRDNFIRVYFLGICSIDSVL